LRAIRLYRERFIARERAPTEALPVLADDDGVPAIVIGPVDDWPG